MCDKFSNISVKTCFYQQQPLLELKQNGSCEKTFLLTVSAVFNSKNKSAITFYCRYCSFDFILNCYKIQERVCQVNCKKKKVSFLCSFKIFTLHLMCLFFPLIRSNHFNLRNQVKNKT